MGEILSFPHDRQHTKSLTVPEIHQCRDPLEVIALGRQVAYLSPLDARAARLDTTFSRAA